LKSFSAEYIELQNVLNVPFSLIFIYFYNTAAVKSAFHVTYRTCRIHYN